MEVYEFLGSGTSYKKVAFDIEFCNLTCRSWTTELEETLKKVLMYMEEECDKYFRVIEHKAIKVIIMCIICY